MKENEILFFLSNGNSINISQLPKVGAGHDGKVYKYGDLAIKFLKYNIDYRKEKHLMTFEKTLYFKEKLHLKRIVKPNDILLDEDGIYSGYVMNYIEDLNNKRISKENYKEPGSYTCKDLLRAIVELEEDFNELSKNKVLAKDVNKGSFLYPKDYLKLCDMDKYLKVSYSRITHLNYETLNYIFSRILAFEMKNENLSKLEKKEINLWIKKCIYSTVFLENLQKELISCQNDTISDFANYQKKKILH